MSLEQAATTLDAERPFCEATGGPSARARRPGIVVDIAGVEQTKIYPPISVAMKNAAVVADKDGFEDRPEFLAIRHAVILSYN